MEDRLGRAESSGGLRHYLDVVRRRKWIVLAVLAVTIGAAAAFSFTQAPRYQAETKIVVGQGNSLFQPTVSNAVQPFTATMGDLVKSRVVAEDAISRVGLDMTPQQLLSKVSVSINPQTAVLKLIVQDRYRTRAKVIAGALGDAFTALVTKRFANTGARGSNAEPPLTASVWDPAHVDPGRVAPKPKRNIAIAAALGLLLALLAAFLRDHFDRLLHRREQVEEHFALPVIGEVPFEKSRWRRRQALPTEFGAGAEAFRALRANLQYLGIDKPLRTILVTSAGAGQGKTTVVAGLGAALARSGARTVIVEGDLRRPRLAEAFGIPDVANGLTNVLAGLTTFEDAVVAIPVASSTRGRRTRVSAAHVDLVPSGPIPPNPSELLGSAQMHGLLDRLEDSYDYVLVDAPPLLPVADALELAREVDGVIVVARRNKTTSDEARDVHGLAERLSIRLVGVVFTGVEHRGGYGYGYQPDSRKDALPLETGSVDALSAGDREPVRGATGARRQSPASRK